MDCGYATTQSAQDSDVDRHDAVMKALLSEGGNRLSRLIESLAQSKAVMSTW